MREFFNKRVKCNLLIVLVLIVFACFSRVVNADSGWDSSYDSGGSSWSDSSSSWDSDSSWDSGSDTYVYGDGVGISSVTVVIIIIIIFIVLVVTKKNGSGTGSFIGNQQAEMSLDAIRKIDPTLDVDALKKQAFDIYKNVQEAWMNFDNDSLRGYVTDEMFNMYQSQLNVLRAKKQKNMMKDIVCNKVSVNSVSVSNGMETVVVYLNVSQYDYVVDKDEKVVRGNDKVKNNVDYLITLTRSMEDDEKIDKCPNCGASLDIISGGVCPYCDSTIVNKSNKFVMSKKECIGQRNS